MNWLALAIGHCLYVRPTWTVVVYKFLIWVKFTYLNVQGTHNQIYSQTQRHTATTADIQTDRETLTDMQPNEVLAHMPVQ